MKLFEPILKIKTELMVEIYFKSLGWAIGRVLLMKFCSIQHSQQFFYSYKICDFQVKIWMAAIKMAFQA